MAEPSPHALSTPVDAAEDPLYDAIAIAFVYAAWAAASTWLGDRAGLAVLVLATTALTVTALAGPSRTVVGRGTRPFVVEFATITLYCATALALSVLAIDTFA